MQKWTMCLDVEHKAIKLVEENPGESLGLVNSS